MGVEDTQYSSHTLRHGFITDLIRKDKNIVKIGKIVGHSTTHITELYEHLISSDLEDLISVLKEDVKFDKMFGEF